MSLKPAKRSLKTLAPRTASPVTTPTYSLTGLPSMAVVVLTIIRILLRFTAPYSVVRVSPYPRSLTVHSCENFEVHLTLRQSGWSASNEGRDLTLLEGEATQAS